MDRPRRRAATSGTATCPVHPLAERGYASIGCWPCTRPVGDGEDARAGRWAGSDKTECGLHGKAEGLPLRRPPRRPPLSHPGTRQAHLGERQIRACRSTTSLPWVRPERTAYERARPCYPPEAVGVAGRAPAHRAGATGRRPRRRHRQAHPAPGPARGAPASRSSRSRACGRRSSATSPGVPMVAATAEELPFAGATLDAVTVAQAFHWFDADGRAHRVRAGSCAPAGGSGWCGTRVTAATTGSTSCGRSWTGSRSGRRGESTSSGTSPRSLDHPDFGAAHRGDVPPRAAADPDGGRRPVPVGEPRRGAPARRAAGACSTRSAHVLDTHPRRPGASRSRSPTGSTPTGASGGDESARAPARASPRAAPPGGPRASPDAAPGTQVSGRVMLGIAPDAARRGRGRPARRARVGDERQDDHHPPARRGAARRRPAGRHEPHRREPARRHRGRARPRPRRPTSRCSRSTSGGCRRSSTRSHAELLVLGNLSRDQLDRFGEVARDRRAVARGVRRASRASRSSRTRPTRTSCGRRSRRDTTWVALGAPWRSDAATCPSCAALLDWADRALRLPRRAASPSPRRRTGSTATRSSSTASGSRSHLAPARHAGTA